MKYVLDTDHASILQRPGAAEYATLVANLNLHSADGIGVSVVSFHEQMLGANTRIGRARSSAELVQGYDRCSRSSTSTTNSRWRRSARRRPQCSRG